MSKITSVWLNNSKVTSGSTTLLLSISAIFLFDVVLRVACFLLQWKLAIIVMWIQSSLSFDHESIAFKWHHEQINVMNNQWIQTLRRQCINLHLLDKLIIFLQVIKHLFEGKLISQELCCQISYWISCQVFIFLFVLYSLQHHSSIIVDHHTGCIKSSSLAWNIIHLFKHGSQWLAS